MLGGRGGRLHAVKRLHRIGAGGDAVERLGGNDRPDAGQQLDDAEAGDAIARVFGKAQQRQHVLDVRGFEEFQPAEFDERDVAAGQFDLERTAVVRGAEQHGLRFERKPGLAALQYPSRPHSAPDRFRRAR